MLYNPLKNLGRIGNVTAAGVAGAERVFDLLDQRSQVEEKPDAKRLKRFQQGLVFDAVRFSYTPGNPDTEVLRGVDLRAERGEVIALVGPSGAGKSTLVNLIPRFFDPTLGCVRIDGCDLRDLTLSSLREQIGMVTQEVILFNDTVANNIAYGRFDPPKTKLFEVAEKAHALDFIKELPQGFNSLIGEGGVRLSGGQRQRIAIARALLRDAPILVLDEATSSLDTQSEREVQLALESLMRNRTTLVIAHRLSTIYRADRILVLDKGTIVEQGSHQELLKQAGLYRRLYELQFSDDASGRNSF
jgi:subfamily B ATP-binding cassette protein MsbA